MREAVLLCLWVGVMGWCVVQNDRPVPPQQPAVVASAEVPAAPEPPKAAPAPKPPLLSRFVLHSNPTLSRKEAGRIAKLVERAALRYSIDVFLFAAIIRQESHFKSGAQNCTEGLGCDGGLGQVNSLWIPVLKLDQRRLVYDDEYNLNVSARILRRVLDQWGHEERAYSRYHNGFPEKRAAYEEKVEKYRILARRLKS